MQNNKLGQLVSRKPVTGFHVELRITENLSEETAELCENQLCQQPTSVEPQ